MKVTNQFAYMLKFERDEHTFPSKKHLAAFFLGMGSKLILIKWLSEFQLLVELKTFIKYCKLVLQVS